MNPIGQAFPVINMHLVATSIRTCPAEGKFLFENFVIGAFTQSLSEGGGGVVYPYPAIDTFDAAVTARVVSAYRKFMYAEKFVSGCRKPGAELEFVT